MLKILYWNLEFYISKYIYKRNKTEKECLKTKSNYYHILENEVNNVFSWRKKTINKPGSTLQTIMEISSFWYELVALPKAPGNLYWWWGLCAGDLVLLQCWSVLSCQWDFRVQPWNFWWSWKKLWVSSCLGEEFGEWNKL